MRTICGVKYLTTKDIRKILKEKYKNKDISENGTIKIVSASFLADKDYIIRKPNKKYQKAEIKWYMSLSRNVNDIAKYYNGKIPKIWQMIADKNGNVNSQYGYRVFSKDFSLSKNKSQWDLAKEALLKDINTRQAVLVYTQPEMHELSTLNGMKDWCCTYSQNFKYENGKLHLVVNMRSSDSVLGVNNDIFWAKYLLKKMAKELNLKPGYIFWHSDDLHVYERDFKYLEENYVL